MVVAPDTQLFVGQEAKGEVTSGTILMFNRTENSWLFVPARKAWVKSSNVIPIEKSEAYFTDVINREPTATAYHHRGIARHALGFDELAMKDLDQAVQLGLRSPAMFINRAIVWHSLGNDQNALSDINQAIEADPKNALAFNNRSLIHASLGDLDESLTDATAAIRLDPDSADALNNRGVTNVKRGEYAAAIKDYTAAVRLNDSFVEAYANRGFAAKKLGNYKAALADYGRAMKLSPQSPQAYNDAAWLLATCPDEEIRNGDQAVTYAKYACKLTDHKNGEFVDTLAAAYAASKDFKQAARTQQQALTLLPSNTQASGKERLELYRNDESFVENSEP